MLPSLRGIFWRIEITQAMGLRLHNLDIVLGFRIKRVTLACDAVSIQLSSLSVCVPIQFMDLQNGTLRSYGFSLSNFQTISSTSLCESAVIGSARSGIAIFCLCFIDTIAAESVSQNKYAPPASLMHCSSMAKSRRPPAVIGEAM